MKPPAPSESRVPRWSNPPWLGVLLALAAILLLLFNQSFQGGSILFSSDGPLGVNAAAYAAMPAAFTGMWQDLNWVGSAVGSAFPSTTYGLLWLLGPLWFAKLYAPASLLLLGLSAWVFFRQLRFRPAVCLLAALAAALNTDFFSYACWGLGTLALAVAATFLALAALVTPVPSRRWIKDALAGLAVGMAVMEGFDSGAILSLYVAAFVLFQAWQAGRLEGLGRGVGRLGIVAGMAVFIAAQALTVLIGTQVKGVVGMEQDQATRAQRWDEATQWSLPKLETLRTVVPGLFGYRMDTPDGGGYWGRVGESPVDPAAFRRHSGAGHYAGVPVVLLGVFGLVQSMRRKGGALRDGERRWVWFWAGAAMVSIAFAWGRHAPFYRLVYALPYFSTIRNPIKFLHPFSLALVVLFAYGAEAFARLYAAETAQRLRGFRAALGVWWGQAGGWEKRWFTAVNWAIGGIILSWLMYGASKRSLEAQLVQTVPTDAANAALIAGFSLREVGWSVLFLILTVAIMALMAARILGGARLRWGLLGLGLLVAADLGRANRPWVKYWEFADYYAPDALTRLLGEAAQEHRVAILSGGVWTQPALLQPLQQAGFIPHVQMLQQLYRGQWLQHQFRYYNVQSLDVVQEPRMPVDKSRYLAAFAARGVNGELRLWELTNTRFLLGLGGDVVTILNEQMDTARQRLRQHTAFTVAQPPGGTSFQVRTNSAGPFAVIEFTGALPRAALYSRWQVETNDDRALQRLADPLFEPAEKVLVSDPLPPPASPGGEASGADAPSNSKVSFVDYAPKRLILEATPDRPSVLLLNDHYAPGWRVFVDDREAPLLRCNYLMRGVFLEPGRHRVEFRYRASVVPFLISLAALGAGAALWTIMVVRGRRPGDAV
ncbi:MAG: hypothetical protein H7A45_19390 [Verrucomicrobiales bacterium]|nr:hypothetical protein [Verrucomicrobiales bacterium]MCP5526987.1 hypothetical protein [Verrucomicrobiales bacterium]